VSAYNELSKRNARGNTMATATVRSINAALKRAGINAEIVRGEGYYYFFGDDVELTREQGVYGVRYLHQLTVEQWVAEAKEKANETKLLRA
jgi:hypothetical protein